MLLCLLDVPQEAPGVLAWGQRSIGAAAITMVGPLE
jgi:hypothetical protein